MLDVNSIRENIESVKKIINGACERAERDPDQITLVAVTKTFGVDVVGRAIEAGVTDIGENYIQEAKEKIESVGGGGADVRWHFIGHLQRNKAKYAVRLFDLIHSVDNINLATELNLRAERGDKVQDILIQINISHEEQKSGVSADGVLSLIREVSKLSHLKIRGLMGMPPFNLEPEESRPYFVTLRGLKEKIAEEEILGVEMTELSMGMSMDYAVAIEEGATMVRVGTAIFGERT